MKKIFQLFILFSILFISSNSSLYAQTAAEELDEINAKLEALNSGDVVEDEVGFRRVVNEIKIRFKINVFLYPFL